VDEFSKPLTFDPDPHQTPTPDPAAILEDTEAECFICKTPLFRSETPNEGNYSREDVFPKWLVEHFGLETAVLDYPGGKSSSYKNILVPCCQPCNNNWMSDVETRIGRAVRAPDQYAEFKKLRRSDIALWTIKIMYGLLWIRIAPWNFKKHKPRPPEVTDTVLDHFRLSLMRLDGFRKRVVLSGSGCHARPCKLRRQGQRSGPGARIEMTQAIEREDTAGATIRRKAETDKPQLSDLELARRIAFALETGRRAAEGLAADGIQTFKPVRRRDD
jgi:hypothetical protein